MDIDEFKAEIGIKIVSELKEVTRDGSNSNGVLLQESRALNLLAQYSDSEDDKEAKYSDSDEGEIHQINQVQYRDPKLSSSSSSESSSEEELNVNEIKKKLEVVSDHDSESDGEEVTGIDKKKKKKEPLRVKGEFLLTDLPPVEELQIQVEEKECLELGTITSIVEDQLVLVEAYHNSTPLNIDSILFIERGKKTLGQIFDVIGPVATPIYCVRFNSNDDIIAKGIAVGDKVFCAPRTEHTSYLVLSSIMGRGSDASWKNDVEPPESLLEYSDDEQERKSRKSKKNHHGENMVQPQPQNFNRQPIRRPRFQGSHPNNNNNSNYQPYPMQWNQQMQPNNFNYFPRYNNYFPQ